MSKEFDDSIYGIRPVIEAINSGKQIDKLLIKQGLVGELAAELMKLLNEKGITYQFVPYERFSKFRTSVTLSRMSRNGSLPLSKIVGTNVSNSANSTGVTKATTP